MISKQLKSLRQQVLNCPPGLKDIPILLQGALIALLFGRLFYDSWIAVAVIMPITVPWYLYQKNLERKRNIRLMGIQFRDAISSALTSMKAGYSVENAFADAVDVLKNMYGDKSLLIDDLVEMNREVMMHVSVERAFLGIVKKYPIEEIESFGEIFLYTKRLGGGYAVYLKDTADRLEERITLQSELDSMISQKKLELTIMSVMPSAILLYMKLTGGSFLQPLYHNALGVVLMIVCLILYGGSVALGNYMIAKVKSEL